jgi:hypothetical protein
VQVSRVQRPDPVDADERPDDRADDPAPHDAAPHRTR